MSAKFRLYPDCKLVRGKKRDAIYDLTRNGIYIVPHEISRHFMEDTIDMSSLPDDKRHECTDFLLKNELGRFDMPGEIIALPDEFISPSIISNAIIDIGTTDLPLDRIAAELSDLVCESVFLRFVDGFSFEHVIQYSEHFLSLSMSSIDIGLQYKDGIERYLDDIVEKIHLCSRILIVNSPFAKTDNAFMGVPVRYIENGYSCKACRPLDYSIFANANLNLYYESLHHNNCLHGKVSIDQYGNVRNCPELDTVFGNVNDKSLSGIISDSGFRKYWDKNKDNAGKCGDCELRYACQHCLFTAGTCTYNVYSD